ncbi:MAG TPA: excinuclease ABC subunit UvrA [Opitutales bacterium]|nr:excinuclease ABC subunit UvrA [Opitutales bacterium]
MLSISMAAKMNLENTTSGEKVGFVVVRGARVHNLKEIDVKIPRDRIVVFTGVSGSGKSSLAFGTLYAEAQRRYLESVAPYARRLFHQIGVPDVDEIDGLPPAVALQQQRGTPSTRSSVGSVTTLSNLLRMLYSRAGDYPPGQKLLEAESFSPNTPEGACPKCHGLGRVYEVTEQSLVPDENLTIRERAVAAWPPAWHGQNLRDILTALGHDIDVPWKELPKEVRDWILFTEEQPVVPVYARKNLAEVRDLVRRNVPADYMGTFTSAKRYVLETFAKTESASMKKRVARYMIGTDCPECDGKRLRREALSVEFAGRDIYEISSLSLEQLAKLIDPYAGEAPPVSEEFARNHPEKLMVMQRIAVDLVARLQVLLDLGLGYLSLDRSTPTLSPGEHQRLRLATQVRSNLFGVAYVLDEPSAGLHPADTEALLDTLEKLRAAGNSLFVVEHEMDVIRRADWIVEVGPAAGEKGGEIVYSGPLEGIAKIDSSETARHLFASSKTRPKPPRSASGWLSLSGISRNNLKNLDVKFPLGVFTTVTGISGSGKSSLVSQVLVELVARELGKPTPVAEESEDENLLEENPVLTASGEIVGGMKEVARLVVVDQKPIGRTPRSNLATYTGLFDHVRKLFAATSESRKRGYKPGRFSFNVAQGRCPKCEGEGWVFVEMLFLPGVYAPCPVCHGARYNPETLEIDYNGLNIAEVLQLTVDAAADFFRDDRSLTRSLETLRQLGLGYLRLGQPATELSGGEAQRIKLATELQRRHQKETLFILDEPTTGLHPSDVEKLMATLQKLVASGNTVILVEHDMQVAAASDWIIDLGPGAGEKGGRIVAAGTPAEVAEVTSSQTAAYLRRALERR